MAVHHPLAQFDALKAAPRPAWRGADRTASHRAFRTVLLPRSVNGYVFEVIDDAIGPARSEVTPALAQSLLPSHFDQ